jgi:hypothetical protein
MVRTNRTLSWSKFFSAIGTPLVEFPTIVCSALHARRILLGVTQFPARRLGFTAEHAEFSDFLGGLCALNCG